MRRLSLFLAVVAAASVAALGRPGEAWAPWATFSDLAANIQRVCTNGTYLQMADVAKKETAEERAALPRTRAGSIDAASPAPDFDEDRQEYDPPDAAAVVAAKDVRLLKKRFTFYDPGDDIELTKEYHRRFLVLWKRKLAPGATVGISFDKFRDPGEHSEVPPVTVADCKAEATSHDEVLVGSGRSERLDAKRGSDQVFAARGRDRVLGRKGHDKLYGGPGSDLVDGGPGNDRVDGGLGADRLRGGSGNDRLDARRDGKDVVDCGTGFDRAYVDRRDVVRANCEVVVRR